MFRSYFLAGFECATGYNKYGEWIDQIAATEHDRHLHEDYGRLAEVGIHAVREAIRWPLVDKGRRYDFSTVDPFVDAALKHDFDVIWDLFHYGYPSDTDPFAADFPQRFADYCHAAASYLQQRLQQICYFTPINEPSFYSWAAGEQGLFAPHAQNRGVELKRILVRAALLGITAIRDACPGARIIHVDPICRVVARPDDTEAVAYARHFNEDLVFQFWDMISGRVMPELGGAPHFLDIMGLNYYWTNQWELGGDGPLAPDDPRRVSLAELVSTVWKRYGTEIVITETSAFGEARGPWIHDLAEVADKLLSEGVQLTGICLYPILGMPEWHARDRWLPMGLWDLEQDQNRLQRKACLPMLEALTRVQADPRRRQRKGEQIFVLGQTGNSTLRITGTMLWQSPEQHGSCRIKLIRSDHLSRRQWIAAIELQTARLHVEHVSTATDIPTLMAHFRQMNPVRLAAEHGITGLGVDETMRTQWYQNLLLLADQAPLFERLTLPPRQIMLGFPPRGGGRY